MSDNKLSSARRQTIAILAALGVAIAFFDRQTMSVLAPVVSADLKLTEPQYALLGSAFALAVLLGSPITGWLIGRVGPRRVLFVAVLAWSAVAMLHSFAAGLGSLLALRIALGFAEAPSIPAALETVERVLPVPARPRATGLLFVGSSIGVLLAAPLAVALEHRFGWRTSFSVAAGFALLAWAPAWFLLTSGRKPRAVMDEQPAREERRRLSRALSVLRQPATLRALAVTAGVMPLITFTTLWEGKWLVHDFGLHQGDLGRYLIVGPILFDVGAFGFGDLASRRIRKHPDAPPPRMLFALAALLVVTGDATAPFAPSAVVAVICNAVAAIGRGAILPLVLSDMARRLPPQMVAPATAAYSGMQSLATVIAALVIGYVIRDYGYPTILVSLAVWAALPATLWLATSRIPPRT